MTIIVRIWSFSFLKKLWKSVCSSYPVFGHKHTEDVGGVENDDCTEVDDVIVNRTIIVGVQCITSKCGSSPTKLAGSLKYGNILELLTLVV